MNSCGIIIKARWSASLYDLFEVLTFFNWLLNCNTIEFFGM